MAMLGPNRNTLSNLFGYFDRQIEKSQVKVKLSEFLELSEAKKLDADVFVVATGATPNIPPIPGVDQEIVMPGVEALSDICKVGHHCIIYGGGLMAMELADLLTDQDNHHIMVIARSEVLKKANFADKSYYLSRLENLGVTILEHTQIIEIQSNSIVLEPANKWRMEILDVDTVIMATGWRPLNDLAIGLTASGFRTMTIGDAVEPRKLLNAIHEGVLAAFEI
jgi:2-enoate reductase